MNAHYNAILIMKWLNFTRNVISDAIVATACLKERHNASSGRHENIFHNSFLRKKMTSTKRTNMTKRLTAYFVPVPVHTLILRLEYVYITY